MRESNRSGNERCTEIKKSGSIINHSAYIGMH